MSYLPLKQGDEIRVVAPSMSYRKSSANRYLKSAKVLEGLGYTVTFGSNIKNVDFYVTATPQDRADDLNAAYQDKKVKAIIAIHGGWSANEVLPLIDWSIVRNNPKPLIGFSDITVLHNAIYAMTGYPSYLGPNLGKLSGAISSDYTVNYLDSVLKQEFPVHLSKSKKWSPGRGEKARKTQNWNVISAGQAEGILLGGNLGTFHLLQGTPYQPEFDKDYILVAEDDAQSGKYTGREFSRKLESILQIPGARDNLRGLLVGRFEPDAKVRPMEFKMVLKSKNLGNIPIISNMDFGHTIPMVTLPVGGLARVSASPEKCEVVIHGV